MTDHPNESRIDAYVEGLLDARERAHVDAHLAGCDRCRDEVAAMRSLLSAMRALPRDIAPDIDLRPGIRAALREREQAEQRRRWSRSLRVPLAAAAVLLVAVTAGVTSLLLADRESVRLTAEEASGVQLASFDVRRADYVRTADELALLLDRHRGQLSPETIALVEESLATIDRALREADAALAADPGSPVVRELILATHEHKVEVLRWANQLGRT